jgi:hypothetical protein
MSKLTHHAGPFEAPLHLSDMYKSLSVTTFVGIAWSLLFSHLRQLCFFPVKMLAQLLWVEAL